MDLKGCCISVAKNGFQDALFSSMIIAPTGHILKQTPQLLQIWLSTIASCSVILTALLGHTLAQAMHIPQSSLSILI